MEYRSISSMALTEEAKKLGLEVEIISKEKNTFFLRKPGKEILFKSTDFGGNSSLGNKLASDKELSYKLLKKNNFPIPKTIYLSRENLKSFDFNTISLKFPLVVKPLKEAHGNGVMMHILSIHELKKKLKSAFKVYSRLIIQEEIQGDEIRVLVAKGRVLLARNRVPAAVIGDGKHSIRKLIAIENQSNPYRGEGYEKPLAFIKIDKELRSYIHKKKLKLRSIPKTGQYIQLRGNSNIGSGGTGIDITNTISDDIKKSCIQAAQIFGLELCGVDVLTTDIHKPLEETGGIILELNSNPGIGGDRELTTVNTGKEILQLLFF